MMGQAARNMRRGLWREQAAAGCRAAARGAIARQYGTPSPAHGVSGFKIDLAFQVAQCGQGSAVALPDRHERQSGADSEQDG